MKRIITIISVALLAVSCVDSTENRYPPQQTKSGYTLVSYAHFSASSVAMLVSELELFNTWFQSDSAKRVYVVETEKWFNSKSILQDEDNTDRWMVNHYYDNILDITMKDGLSLSEIGAQWSVKCSNPYMAIKNRAAIFERISPDSLSVTFTDGWTRTDYSFVFVNASFMVVYPAAEVLLHKRSFAYKISGSAQCRSIGDAAMTMNFDAINLTGTTQYSNDIDTQFSSGRLNVSASKMGETKSASGIFGEFTTIYYQNVSERYNPLYLRVWY